MPEFPAAGVTVGTYRIGRVLGAGPIGVTYAAVDLGRSGGHEVAVKVMLPRRPLEALPAAALSAELEALVEARSRGILVPREHTQVDGRYVTVSPLFRAGSLQQLLDRSGPLPRREALAVAAHVARALHDAHRIGVFHGAVKPTNVFPSTRDGALVPMLADFGSVLRARPWHVPPRARPSYGQGFVAPEILGPNGAPGDARGDVYSLGCLLFALRTGNSPYQGPAPANPSAIPQLPVEDATDEALNALIARSLQPDPAHRFASIEEMGEQLTELAHAPAAPRVDPAGTESETTILPPIREPLRRDAPPAITSAEPVADAPVVDAPAADAPAADLPAAPPAPTTPPGAALDGESPPVDDEGDLLVEPRASNSRRALMALAVAAAIAAIVVVSVLHRRNLEPHSTPPPTGSASGGSSSSGTHAHLPAPSVTARPAYRAVNFELKPPEGATGTTVQIDTGSGWQETTTDEVSVATPMGGRQACIKARAVSGDQESRTVHRCGTSEAPVITMAPIGACTIGTTDYTSCYRLRLRGFEPGALQVDSSAPDSAGQIQHYTDPIQIAKDGTGEDPARFGANTTQTVSVSAAGVEKTFTIGG
ncbi:MAG TPA: serine/threonine-protein kinase [Marmoricola sp.]